MWAVAVTSKEELLPVHRPMLPAACAALLLLLIYQWFNGPG
jgi:hypothetical protein